ncbi:cytochrome c oxidase subunit II [Caulobacter sp. FWC2]|uniref:cytochrome c oxidase subunit II n=1 Tax=Caulobacter sp. FWC2 TaxID=69664 RepID=UPI000C15CB1B|nr:cytochrome c oxidase subunit II [Caulobacter sp. FWC2]PIB91028.1 cytochrome c oxidase subunit II [Caulobacter sp. FWC2]
MTTRTAADESFKGWPPPVLDPAGPFAAPLNTLTWGLLAMAVLVMAVVLVALAIALFAPRAWRQRLGGERLIWIAGLGFPVVVLSALLVWGLSLTSRLSEAPQPGDLRVRVTGEMWWWRVAYLDAAGRELFQDANEIHVPVGRTIALELESTDVIHSFWVPRLAGKLDMIPGRRNVLRIQADRPGTYSGQCAEYCGGAHALMAFVVIAHAPEDYVRWRERAARPAAALPQQAAGAAVFERSGCGACHTIRGTSATGVAGPDLTHVGSRRTLGAGVLPNNAGTMGGWIADSQAIKPGNRMPAYPVLSGQDLRAVSAYLESLK